MGASVVEQLAKLSEGLEYPSETDAPFEAFCWRGKLGVREMIMSRAKGRVVEEVSVAELFLALDESEDARRFRELQRGLISVLNDLKVFRVGEVRVEVYLIGRTAAGECAGLKTVSVET